MKGNPLWIIQIQDIPAKVIQQKSLTEKSNLIQQKSLTAI